MTRDELTIGNRYRLLDRLGEGGMGAVYRALDRLTGETVALKLVAVAPDQLRFASQSNQDPTLALAQEFQILASLRHPHIIAVRDYGFDLERRPFFTMDLLEQPRTIVEVAQGQPLDVKINLLQQMLLALVYLHRRGIVHRDLKPGNVLVANGTVKVTDFGLSVAVERADANRAGSLGYMAPEVLLGEPVTPAADLYAVGVIAYELFAGQHPFDTQDLSTLIDQILETSPAQVLTRIDSPVTAILERLLAKTPAERYPDATAVIRALGAATGQPLALETLETRESFLQAAKFVGREAELNQLSAALAEAQAGRGSAWLIGGESGVGKSRLADELRTRALIAGALVLRGQVVEGGGLPYQLWREPLRRLALSTDLSDFDAGVLKAVVPDIGTLLRQGVPEVPELPGVAGRERLALTIVETFKRQTQPTVLLAEDLQWSEESLEPLRHLARVTNTLPLLIVGNYRDDERPGLPERLPGMQRLKLERLTDTAIAELSSSMLGEVGQQPQVLDLVKRETEGNTFFIVEVVRALAEEAGQLSEIGRKTLPASVFAGGMQAVIRRRWECVPLWARPLLQVAALMGRQLDLKVLCALDSQIDLDRWLTVVSEAAVLEVQDEQWRFAHDKLRKAIVSDIPVIKRPALHRRIAQALEAVYPNDNTLAEVLLGHWQAASDEAKELHYLEIVARRLNQLGLDALRARQLLEHGLELAAHMPDVDRLHMRLRRQLGDVCELLGDLAAAKDYCEQSLALAELLDDNRGRAGALYGLGCAEWDEGNYAQAAQYLWESLRLARAVGDHLQMASTLNLLGIVKSNQADYTTARDYYQQSLALCRELADECGIAVSLGNLGNNARRQGDYVAAMEYLSEGLAHARKINARRTISDELGFLALVARKQGDLASALDYISQCLIIDRETDDRLALTDDTIARASIQLDLHDNSAARDDLRQGLRLAKELGAVPEILDAVIGFARLSARTDQAERAAEFAGLVSVHPALTLERRQNDLDPLLVELKVVLPPNMLAAAMERGHSLDLSAVAQEWLDQPE